jgi:hypothetical protein
MTRGRWLIAICLLGLLTVAGALGYKRWPQLFRKTNNPKATTPVASPNQNELASIPPFSTKEPDRYQAKRIITNVEYPADPGGKPVTTSSTTLIARDGINRREEYETGANETVVFLETPAGRFILFPTKKLYADLKSSTGDAVDFTVPGELSEAFSPDRLLNETRALARYEMLGPETVNGRATTKYRVTRARPGESAGNESAPGGVTLIWIDDALGLPIRSETSSTASDHQVKQTIELKDLKQTIDAGVFDLPKDYKLVDYSRLFPESPQPSESSGVEQARPPKP